MPTQDYQSAIAEEQYRKAKLKKAKKLDPAVFRVGDRVKIVNPYKFVRCGYPYDKAYAIRNLITTEEKYSIAQLLDFEGTLEMFNGCLSIKDPSNLFNEESPFSNYSPEGIKRNNTYCEILDRLAYFKLNKCGFGGNMRQIFVELDNSLTNGIYYVNSKRTVYTGTRTSGYYDPEYGSYESAYLTNMKAHVILRLLPQSDTHFVCDSDGFEIEAKNCQKIIDSK